MIINRYCLFSANKCPFDNVRILCVFSCQCIIHVPSITELLLESTRSKNCLSSIYTHSLVRFMDLKKQMVLAGHMILYFKALLDLLLWQSYLLSSVLQFYIYLYAIYNFLHLCFDKFFYVACQSTILEFNCILAVGACCYGTESNMDIFVDFPHMYCAFICFSFVSNNFQYSWFH